MTVLFESVSRCPEPRCLPAWAARRPRGVSDTTLRARRDESADAGVFEEIAAEALAAYDSIIDLDLSEVSSDGSLHNALCGG